jgi:ectoine hydroxylase-related dioxygenase (phytanoyl-CoA dioxygenase family)
MCGVWIALENIGPGSGPLLYYPGSQKLPILSVADLNGASVDQGYTSHIARTLETSGHKPETALIKRGQAFIWAANLFHGGSRVSDLTATRLSQVTHYYFRGCSYFTPKATNAATGKVFWREPYDLNSGRFVSNADKTARPRLTHRVGERLRIWRKQPHVD